MSNEMQQGMIFAFTTTRQISQSTNCVYSYSSPKCNPQLTFDPMILYVIPEKIWSNNGYKAYVPEQVENGSNSVWWPVDRRHGGEVRQLFTLQLMISFYLGKSIDHSNQHKNLESRWPPFHPRIKI